MNLLFVSPGLCLNVTWKNIAILRQKKKILDVRGQSFQRKRLIYLLSK